jgi:acyl carrier protein
MGGGMSEAVADDSLVGRIRGLVSEQLGVSISEVTSDANILDDLGADSLDVVEMVMAIEETFDIEISDEDTEAMRTIGDVETYVSKRLAG